MSDSKKITLSELKNDYSCGLRIPAIQRDYVMGAGGKSDNDEEDKLDKLLNAILVKFKAKEDFDFSCIITYCSDPAKKPLEIYDGQQRLTTLMLMILYKLRSENEKDKLDAWNGWYCFEGRPRANEILKMLTNKENEQIDIKETDFTSFSMNKLWGRLKNYKEITSDYLLNNVKFDMVSIGSQNEIEQFFMDLNSGVKLKDYELYKAKLTHKVNQMKENIIISKNNIEAFEMWSHKLDNEWLDFFDRFSEYKHPAEEYEVAFIKYCIDMFFVENDKAPVNGQIESITADVIIRVYDVMEMLTKLDLSLFKNKKEELLKEGIMYFSEIEIDSDKNSDKIMYKIRYDKLGAFWNLDFEEYDRLLYYVIKFVLLNANASKEMTEDLLLWCFITTVDWQINVQNEYLRLIKIILNHNVLENKDAWYECQNNGQYLYYCKYSVYAIPQYYGKHLSPENIENLDKLRKRHSDMFGLNKSVIRSLKKTNMLNRGMITRNLMEQIKNLSKEREIAKIIEQRIQLLEKTYENTKTYADYLKDENNSLGIVEKMEQSSEKEKYYLAEVKLDWPVTGKNQKITCLVKLKCRTDFLFEEYNKDNALIVTETIDKKDISFTDKCFWKHKNEKRYVGRIMDRESQKTKTYLKNGSESDKGWCKVWYWDETGNEQSWTEKEEWK